MWPPELAIDLPKLISHQISQPLVNTLTTDDKCEDYQWLFDKIPDTFVAGIEQSLVITLAIRSQREEREKGAGPRS